MSERLSDIGGKLLAGAVLLIAGWILMKFVLGLLTWLATVVIAILAIVAVFWALNRLF
jgi:hypothetical protein